MELKLRVKVRSLDTSGLAVDAPATACFTYSNGKRYSCGVQAGESAWFQHSFPMTVFRGRPIRLQFRASFDEPGETTSYVDDVVLTTTAGSL